MVTKRMEDQVCLLSLVASERTRDGYIPRVVLNYKGIPHKTKWVDFPDIDSVAKRIGAPHTFVRRSGQPLYTVPILRDTTLDRSIAGSLQIALDLERRYPNSPKLFPPGMEGIITDFDNKFTRSVGGALAPLLLSRIWAQLRDGSKDYFRTSRERMYGETLEALSAPGAATAARWAAVRVANRIYSFSVSEKHTPMSSRHVGLDGLVGPGAQKRRSGPN